MIYIYCCVCVGCCYCYVHCRLLWTCYHYCYMFRIFICYPHCYCVVLICCSLFVFYSKFWLVIWGGGGYLVMLGDIIWSSQAISIQLRWFDQIFVQLSDVDDLAIGSNVKKSMVSIMKDSWNDPVRKFHGFLRNPHRESTKITYPRSAVGLGGIRAGARGHKARWTWLWWFGCGQISNDGYNGGI